MQNILKQHRASHQRSAQCSLCAGVRMAPSDPSLVVLEGLTRYSTLSAPLQSDAHPKPCEVGVTLLHVNKLKPRDSLKVSVGAVTTGTD